MGRKKYSVGTLCLKKYSFCRKKIMSRQFVSKKIAAALRSEKKYFDSEKKPQSPPPLKLNGRSLTPLRFQFLCFTFVSDLPVTGSSVIFLQSNITFSRNYFCICMFVILQYTSTLLYTGADSLKYPLHIYTYYIYILPTVISFELNHS